jgi:hypothetical protein
VRRNIIFMQSVTLSSEERQVVLDYAAHLEKRSRHWRAWRWMAVGCFTIGLVLLFAVTRMSVRMYSAFELPPEALSVSETASPKAIESSLRLVVAHADAQVAVLRAEMSFIIRALIVAGVGTALFIHVVSEWGRDRRDRLVVRLLRAAVACEQGGKNES